ncbi:uncharacterized protein BJX67DRAFT_377362 [Aspergillus lucknowensis]|uniref:Uncharacterized protein n=1 Tax=Aspergillus lucknowensis TaxID=176173 RepID=A0ABR4M4T9_9EURO
MRLNTDVAPTENLLYLPWASEKSNFGRVLRWTAPREVISRSGAKSIQANGWDIDILQEAIDTCDDAGGDITKCAALALYEDSFTEGCILEPSIDEKVNGWLDALPGCNPVQAGPEDAKATKDCSAPTEIGEP